MKKPKSIYTQRQDCANSIMIEDQKGNEIAHIIANENVTPEHEKIARLFEMAPTMKALLEQFIIKVDIGKARSTDTYGTAKSIIHYIDQ